MKKLIASVALFTGLASIASADLTFNITVSGGNVFMTGSGSMITGSLTLSGSAYAAQSNVNPSSSPLGGLGVGPSNTVNQQNWLTVSGPTFGPGGFTSSSSGTGDQFGFGGTSVVLPFNYVSGSALSGTATFTGASLASLGLTAGSYNYTVSGGQAISLNISAVPEPSTYAAIAGAAMLGLAVWRRQGQRKSLVAGPTATAA